VHRHAAGDEFADLVFQYAGRGQVRVGRSFIVSENMRSRSVARNPSSTTQPPSFGVSFAVEISGVWASAGAARPRDKRRMAASLVHSGFIRAFP